MVSLVHMKLYFSISKYSGKFVAIVFVMNIDTVAREMSLIIRHLKEVEIFDMVGFLLWFLSMPPKDLCIRKAWTAGQHSLEITPRKGALTGSTTEIIPEVDCETQAGSACILAYEFSGLLQYK